MTIVLFIDYAIIVIAAATFDELICILNITVSQNMLLASFLVKITATIPETGSNLIMI